MARTRTPRPLDDMALRAAAVAAGKAIAGGVVKVAVPAGRQSVDTSDFAGISTGAWVARQPDEEYDWRLRDLDDRTLDRISTRELLTMLVSINPDMANGLYMFLRMCNPGIAEFAALQLDRDEEHPEGQVALRAMRSTLETRHGSLDVPIARLFMGAWLRGAFVAETVLGEDRRTFIDLATPDPASIRWKHRWDKIQGPYWVPFQYQQGKPVELLMPTFAYIPVDPFPGRPEGRSLANPALFPSLFLVGMIRDLRRVVAQQGYPRLDISVDLNALRQGMPEDVAENPQKYNAWLKDAIQQVIDVYNTVGPDSAYVHSTAITVNRPVGTVDASSLGAVDGLCNLLERQIARALKTMPILMGIQGAADQTDANRQWEIQAAGIKSFQHACESLLGSRFGLALQAQGIACRVVVRFAELRASEEQRDALTLQAKIKALASMVLMGWETNESACKAITGHTLPPDALPFDVDVVATVATGRPAHSGGGGGPGMASEPEPSAARSLEEDVLALLDGGRRVSAERASFTPKGAKDGLPELPDSVTFDPADRDALAVAWDGAVGAKYRGLLEAEVTADENT